MDASAPSSQEVWCRLVTAGTRVLRVQIMHPDGQVLAAYAPERFEPAVVRQMLAGQIRAAVSRPDGVSRQDPVLRLTSLAGAVLFEEPLEASPTR